MIASNPAEAQLEHGEKSPGGGAAADRTDAGRNDSADRHIGRLPGTKTRRPARPQNDVDRSATNARLRDRLERVRTDDNEKMCVTMRAGAS